jgi:RNA polymerase sigma-70 factor (TIGR02957 family)
LTELNRDLYEELRPRAFAIAYRMLGTVSEAEDLVQEALLRLHSVLESGEEIASPPAYVATVVTRLAIDELRSARARRESYVGEWLPEPVLTEERDTLGGVDPARAAELSDSLSFAFLVLLEKLTPEQRAVFLLHDVFDYPYADVAEVVGRSEAATRQLGVRARARVEQDRPAYDVSREQEEALAEKFFGAVQKGDVEALEELLAADVELHGDGGGKAPALARPVHGRERAARTLSAWARTAERIGGLVFHPRRMNGAPGAVTMTPDGRVISVLVLEIAAGRIQAVRGVVNPDKLAHLGRVADVNALLRGEG